MLNNSALHVDDDPTLHEPILHEEPFVYNKAGNNGKGYQKFTLESKITYNILTFELHTNQNLEGNFHESIITNKTNCSSLTHLLILQVVFLTFSKHIYSHLKNKGMVVDDYHNY